jgi:hypothetical protein
MGTTPMERSMQLNNLFFVRRNNDGKVTLVTDHFFGGDPNYFCEAATPQQISAACKADRNLQIRRG